MRQSPRSWRDQIPASPGSTPDERGDTGAGRSRSHQVLLGQAGSRSAGPARAGARGGPGIAASRRGQGHGGGGGRGGGQGGQPPPPPPEQPTLRGGGAFRPPPGVAA